jgi:hypothetical protein
LTGTLQVSVIILPLEIQTSLILFLFEFVKSHLHLCVEHVFIFRCPISIFAIIQIQMTTVVNFCLRLILTSAQIPIDTLGLPIPIRTCLVVASCGLQVVLVLGLVAAIGQTPYVTIFFRPISAQISALVNIYRLFVVDGCVVARNRLVGLALIPTAAFPRTDRIIDNPT